MIKRVQVLWYLDKEDFENYCLDFKPYESHKLEGYEICDVDEDLIDDLCGKDYDKYELLGYFKNEKEIQNHIKKLVEDREFDLELDSPELNEKISKAIATVYFKGEDYYISIGTDEICSPNNEIVNWYDGLKDAYDDDMWILAVTGYDAYDLKPSGKVLTYILSDILNLNESYFNDIIPNKGLLEIEEWNEILDKVYRKNKLNLGLKRVV